MHNHPQLPIEEITLIPHPLDAWRMALNALIAVAPGTSIDIAWHLKDAREKTLQCRSFSAATPVIDSEATPMSSIAMLRATMTSTSVKPPRPEAALRRGRLRSAWRALTGRRFIVRSSGL